MKQRPPIYLSPQARVTILTDMGLETGWVLLTMEETETMTANIRAYAKERRQILEAAYALRDAVKCMTPIVAKTSVVEYVAEELQLAAGAMLMPLPPKPLPREDPPLPKPEPV